VPHTDPEDPPRRRANKARGHGSWDNDRPPVCGVVGRESGQARLTVAEHSDRKTLEAVVYGATGLTATVDTDEWGGYDGLAAMGRGPATVCRADREWARDDDGDGVREVHENTLEGIWTGLRNFLRPFRGVSKKYLYHYMATFEWGDNVKRVTPKFLDALRGASLPPPALHEPNIFGVDLYCIDRLILLSPGSSERVRFSGRISSSRESRVTGDQMRPRTGQLRYLTLALAVSLARPANLPLLPPDDGVISPAEAGAKEDGACRPGVNLRVDAHSSRHTSCGLAVDDPSEETEEGDDFCPPSPIECVTVRQQLRYLISALPHLLDSIPARTSRPLGVVCRLRC
jgi:transposase